MKKKFFLSALLISLFSLAAAKPVQADTSVADIQKRGELVVGVKQDVPNFGYKNPKTGTYSGIETDLAKMIADELKVKPFFLPSSVIRRWVMEPWATPMVLPFRSSMLLILAYLLTKKPEASV